MKKTEIQQFGISFNLYVYTSNDYVSNIILREKSWETGETKAILSALRNYKEKHGIKNLNDVLFLDIGAQIGWHSLVAASHGFKVMAFEPMEKSQYLFRRNICFNRSLDIININKGL